MSEVQTISAKAGPRRETGEKFLGELVLPLLDQVK
jgi:hypothetical protein